MSKLENDNCGTSCGCAPEALKTDGYWQDVENKVLDPKDLSNEFTEDEFDSFSVKKSRRSFLKIMGYSVTALPLAGCIKIPVKKALPYLNKQNDTIPGVANWYASSFKGVPVLVKTREGRPIKIEGNDKSTVTKGGAGAQTQASVLSLYDSNRLRSAMISGKDVEWDEFDTQLKSQLSTGSGDVYVVTPSISSSSELAVINDFTKKFNAKHIAYDSVSSSAMTKANMLTHGSHTETEYDFEKADLVVSIGADFLGMWGSVIGNTKKYTARRDAKHANGMNKHYQVEARMSLTGSNADYRFTKSVADQNDILLGLLAAISGQTHATKKENSETVKLLAKELTAHMGKSIVACGNNNANAQVVVNKINAALNNYSNTMFVYKSSGEVLANDEKFETFVSELNKGSARAVLFVGVNPAYDYYNSVALTKGLSKVTTKVSFAMSADETSVLCNFVAPANHTYESWGDTKVSSTEVSIVQPVIQPLFGTRMWTETLMSATGTTGNFHGYLQTHWTNKGVAWNQFVHDGIHNTGAASQVSFNGLDVSSYTKALKVSNQGTGLNIVTFSKYGIGNGDMANNPWLQELPNPITKGTWDNYAMISPAFAKSKKIKSGDLVEVTNGSHTITLPAIVQPGNESNTIAIALGYGRSVAGKVAKNLGGNAFPFVKFNGTFDYSSSFGTIKKTGAFKGLAQTQTHHSMEGRDIVRETTFAEYLQNPKSGNQVHKPKIVHIYPEHKKDGHQWAMAANLSQCTGCSSCIISCSAENNVPVVGRKEVANRREMHWLRIDRYYKGDENQPEVMHMPMLCQHCDNAPCENVCPVLATTQSSDGLNQQVYNRCVGTRYCANNCPYKVRRFNWFNYDHSDEIEKMVLNPDVSIRSRGIMEKCSMCVQRIQEGKLEAKRARRELKDGDIKLACQQSCPGDGIVFGDMNDPESKISKMLDDERNYTVLEELNVQPRVSYLTKIRNK
jgi:molybdopterin-containing oxidoreductase family iron-sulfur binding subunit